MALPSFTFTIPRFKLPAFVSAVGNKLPQWPHALVLVTGLNAVLKPGATVVLLDNRYVEGSSSPVTEHDADGNSYQTRKLTDGSLHRVLKNFPVEAELKALVDGLSQCSKLTCWPYYWAFEYVTAAH